MRLANACALAALYALFIAYSALSAQGVFAWPAWPALSLRDALAIPHAISRADVLVNVLGYAPFGYLLAQAVVAAWLARRPGTAGLRFAVRVALAATLAAAIVSATTEVLQTGIDGRVSSMLDLAANTLGALTGALARPVFHHAFDPSGRYSRAMFALVAPEALPRLAVAALGLWLADRWWPLAFTLDVGAVRAALRPLKAWATGAAPFSVHEWARYGWLHLSALLLVTVALASRRARWLAAPVFVAGALAVKIACGRTLRIEELAGAACALAAGLALAGASRRTVLAAGALACAAALAWAELGAAGLGGGPAGMAAAPFNWVPFATTLAREDLGIAPFLGLGAHLAPAAYFTWRLARPDAARALASAAAVAAAVFALEWAQTRIASRHGDITLVVVAAALWLALAAVGRADRRAACAGRAGQPADGSRQPVRSRLLD